MLRLFYGLALTILLGCAARTAYTVSPLRQIPVSSVTGFHDGKCGPARIVEIATAIASLTSKDLGLKARCNCFYATYHDLMDQERSWDHYRSPHYIENRENFLTIQFKKPISLPAPRPKPFEPKVRELVVKAAPNSHWTIIHIGYRAKRDSKLLQIKGKPNTIIFVSYKIPGDRFGLGNPGEECTAHPKYGRLDSRASHPGSA